MATNLQALAFEKAEILSSRLKEIISSGQGFVQKQFGVDLGLNPDAYPPWLVLSTAALGLLLLLVAALVLSRVALCGGGGAAGKARGPSPSSPLTTVRQAEKPLLKADVNSVAKADEQKRKTKKKSADKKSQPNGRQFSAPPADTASNETPSPPQPPQILPSKQVQQVQPVQPVQVKKSKKKAKAAVPRPVASVITGDVKEPDEGAWQTQVSQRERRQQRRKDKAPEDPGSSGDTKAAPKTHVETPVTSTNRSRGRKGDPATNGGGGGGGGGGGRADVSLKPPGPSAGAGEREKWSSTAARYRAQPEAKLWGQEKQAPRSGAEGRTNADVKPTASQGPKPAEHASLPVSLQWDVHPDDEWCGLNGGMGGDAGSDWSAPLVHWGHYEEPCPPVVASGPSAREQPGPHKVLDGEKAADDSAGGTKSAKRKKKKNKNADEDATAGAQVGGTIPKAQEAPAGGTSKHSVKRPDSEKKSEQRTEPLKPATKKRV